MIQRVTVPLVSWAVKHANKHFNGYLRGNKENMKQYKRSKYKIMARQIALEAVRNTYLEDLHATCTEFGDKEMRKLMLEIEENLRVSLWFWDRKKNDKNLLKQVEDNLFGEYGISWDIPNKKYKEIFKKSSL